MPGFKRFTIAAAVVAACGVSSVFAQSFATAGAAPGAFEPRIGDTPGERAAAVIRSIDNETAAPSAPVNAAADLAPLRAGGDMRTAERSAPVLVERIRIDDPARSGNKAQPAGAMRNSSSAQGQGNVERQIVHIEGQAKDRAKPQAATRLDDRARYREQAKYEADKKRRETAAASEQAKTTASDSAQSRIAAGPGRAEIRWSEPADRSAAVESSEGTAKN